jgi:hypothetical protein
MALNWEILAYVSRLSIAGLSMLMAIFFFKKYGESKASGTMPNYYFLGNSLFFLAMGSILLIVGVLEAMASFAEVKFNFDTNRFPGYVKGDNDLLFLENLGSNPIYVALTIFSLVMFSVQIFPLEIILGKKKIVSKFLLFAAALCILIYIPSIQFTYYSFGILLIAYFCVFLGLLMNCYLTGTIIKNSAGIVKKRAMMNFIGFFLFLIGLVWSMRVGWMDMILHLFGVDGPLDMDVLAGSIVMLFAMFLYWRGFSTKAEI